MSYDCLEIIEQPRFDHGRLVMGLQGWMDGGEVSIGATETIIDLLKARKVARIKPQPFYLYNFPGSMELTSLFRPYIEINDGIITDYREPDNIFFADDPNQLLLFVGKEPHLNWETYSEKFFTFIQQCNIKEVYFIGSVAGLVPHTRDPRISATVSHPYMRDRLDTLHLKPTFYQGPGSIINSFLRTAGQCDIEMMTLVAEIPAYVQGRNPRSIEVMIRRVSAILGLELNLDRLRNLGDLLEKKIDKAVAEREELATHIKKLEENYDREVFDNEMGDLKTWLEDQGIRLD
ncbi:MAG: PAC2 family protein [Sedimentisphaerales bacterium]|nr:PAC2 family protein [Sedimentisphaerales bacterium]